jgi:hypothetical protein
MNFLELQDTLQNLTNQKIFLADFAKILDCGKANISKRAKNNSEITVSELMEFPYTNLSLQKNQNSCRILTLAFSTILTSGANVCSCFRSLLKSLTVKSLPNSWIYPKKD